MISRKVWQNEFRRIYPYGGSPATFPDSGTPERLPSLAWSDEPQLRGLMGVKSGYTFVLAADAATAARIKALRPRVQALETLGWVSLPADSSPRPTIDPQDSGVSYDASREFNEAFHVSCQENVNGFNYFHYVRGRLIRELHYVSDHGWWGIKGTAEPWEAEIIPGTVAEGVREPTVDAFLIMSALSSRMGWRVWQADVAAAMKPETAARIAEFASLPSVEAEEDRSRQEANRRVAAEAARLCAAGQAALAAGEIGPALDQFEAALRQDSDFPAASLGKGDCLYAQDLWIEAEACFYRVLNRDPAAAARLALSVATRGNHRGAALGLKKKLDEPGEHPEEERRLLNALEKLAAGDKRLEFCADPESFFRLYREALELAPHLDMARCRLAVVLNLRGRHQEAVEAFAGRDAAACLKRFLKLAPKAEGLSKQILSHAPALLQRLETPSALAEPKPSLHEARSRVAARARADDAAGLVEALRVLVSLEPRDRESRRQLGIALAQAGRSEDSVSILASLLAEAPGDADTNQNLGRVLLDLGKINEALPHFQRAVGSNPAASPSWNGLRECLDRLGRLDEALSAAERHLSLAAESEVQPLMLIKASLLDRLGRREEAAKLAQAALALPDFREFWRDKESEPMLAEILRPDNSEGFTDLLQRARRPPSG